MEPIKIAKERIGLQRTLFDNSYNVVTVLPDNSENMIKNFLNQFPWVNEDAKKPFNDSAAFIKKAREDHRKTIDQGFDKLAELVDNKQDRAARKG
jgi:hypothetical protein